MCAYLVVCINSATALQIVAEGRIYIYIKRLAKPIKACLRIKYERFGKPVDPFSFLYFSQHLTKTTATKSVHVILTTTRAKYSWLLKKYSVGN